MPPAHLPDQRTQRITQSGTLLDEIIAVQDSDPPHVGLRGEPVEVAALGIQLREHFIQTANPDDFFAHRTGGEAIRDGYARSLGPLVDGLLLH